MGEPLKRSFMGEIIHSDFTEPDKDTYYLEQDILSAIEYLNVQDKMYIDMFIDGLIDVVRLSDKLKENRRQAFQDVIRK